MDFNTDGPRWQDEEQLHLTLRFIGEVGERTGDDIVTALGDLRAAPVVVTLSQIGTFDRRGRVETLWIGAHPREPLTALHCKIDRTLVATGLPPEGRAFVPHVTLARFGRRDGECGAWIAAHAGVALPPFTATAFELVESTLNGDGAEYETIARYPLRL